MFGFNIGKDKGEKEINIFDVKAVDELIDKNNN